MSESSLKIDIERVTPEGYGIGWHDGKTIFCHAALPSKGIAIEPLQKSKKIHWAVAAERPETTCPHFLECGGCSWLHTTEEEERSLKNVAIRENIKRLSAEDPGPPEQDFWVARRGHRQRARFRINQAGKLSWAPHPAHRGNRGMVYPGAWSEPCMVLAQPLQELVKRAHIQFVKHPPRGIDRDNLPEFLATCTPAGETAWSVKRAPRSWHSDLAGYVSRSAPPALPLDWDGGYTVYNDPRLFFQPSLAAATHTANLVRSWAGDLAFERVVDLYGGQGTWASLFRQAHDTSIWDFDGVALGIAREQGIKTHRADLDNITAGQIGLRDNDLVIVDPPRTGIGSTLRQDLAAHKGPILYISCNPATFARDAKALYAGDYQLARWAIIHQFPGTAHTEVAGVFLPPTRST